eukprot:5169358-Prymnesium_polylepis.1
MVALRPSPLPPLDRPTRPPHSTAPLDRSSTAAAQAEGGGAQGALPQRGQGVGRCGARRGAGDEGPRLGGRRLGGPLDGRARAGQVWRRGSGQPRAAAAHHPELRVERPGRRAPEHGRALHRDPRPLGHQKGLRRWRRDGLERGRQIEGDQDGARLEALREGKQSPGGRRRRACAGRGGRSRGAGAAPVVVRPAHAARVDDTARLAAAGARAAAAGAVVA